MNHQSEYVNMLLTLRMEVFIQEKVTRLSFADTLNRGNQHTKSHPGHEPMFVKYPNEQTIGTENRFLVARGFRKKLESYS